MCLIPKSIENPKYKFDVTTIVDFLSFSNHELVVTVILSLRWRPSPQVWVQRAAPSPQSPVSEFKAFGAFLCLRLLRVF